MKRLASSDRAHCPFCPQFAPSKRLKSPRCDCLTHSNHTTKLSHGCTCCFATRVLHTTLLPSLNCCSPTHLSSSFSPPSSLTPFPSFPSSPPPNRSGHQHPRLLRHQRPSRRRSAQCSCCRVSSEGAPSRMKCTRGRSARRTSLRNCGPHTRSHVRSRRLRPKKRMLLSSIANSRSIGDDMNWEEEVKRSRGQEEVKRGSEKKKSTARARAQTEDSQLCGLVLSWHA